MAKYIKDLDTYLTEKTGLDKKQRAAWRNKIKKLLSQRKTDEALKCMQSISYYKAIYLKPIKKK
jgi:hypothetical protein